MSFFQSIQPKGSKPIQPKTSTVRKEVVNATPATNRVLRLSPFPAKTRASSIPVASKRHEIREQSRSVSARTSRRQTLSAQPRLESDSDDLESDSSLGPLRKRVKVSGKYELDLKRKLRCKAAFSESGDDRFSMVHAADIASLGRTPKYKVAFPDVLEAHTVLVQYPSASRPERLNFNPDRWITMLMAVGMTSLSRSYQTTLNL